MSRVFEAMRRAAEKPQPGVTSAEEATVAAVASIDVPPPTNFPAESPAGSTGSAPEARVARPAKPQSSFSRVAASAGYAGKTILHGEMNPQSREQYRRVAASLHDAQALQGTKVVMITSALVGEGKTLTAANIALTLSHSYKKQVLLMDADLRRPSLPSVLGIKTDVGLTEGLTGTSPRAVPIHQVSSRLGILAAGRPTSDPIAALTSDRMRRLIEDARQMFDWVIIDTPPVALLTDASLLWSVTDGAILVIKAGHTPYDLVQRAVAAIGRERMLGVVLNRAVVPAQGSGYYDDYYYYGSKDAE
jgi:capsular exopolysaccharide synthesis family protein